MGSDRSMRDPVGSNAVAVFREEVHHDWEENLFAVKPLFDAKGKNI